MEPRQTRIDDRDRQQDRFAVLLTELAERLEKGDWGIGADTPRGVYGPDEDDDAVDPRP